MQHAVSSEKSTPPRSTIPAVSIHAESDAYVSAALIAPFLFLDLTFLSANLLKVLEGGWVPLALGGFVMTLMYTWRRGSRLLFEKSRKLEFPLADLVTMLEKRPPQRVAGTAVFLTSDPLSAPTALVPLGLMGRSMNVA